MWCNKEGKTMFLGNIQVVGAISEAELRIIHH